MADEPMKFCASLGKCSKAYTVDAPGRVKIALDRAATDDRKVNVLLEFLANALSPQDYAKAEDLLDSVLDDAETANPSTAQDGMTASVLRAARRAKRPERIRRRTPALGYDARPASPSADFEAEMRAAFPNAYRLGR